MHSDIEFFGGYESANDWYIPSAMQSPLENPTLAEWDAALYKIEDGEETLLTDSIIEITPELQENHALLPYNRTSRGEKLIVHSILPDTDNPNTTLFTYNPEANEFQPFSEELSAMYSQISPKGTKTMFANHQIDQPHSIQIFDLQEAKLLEKVTLEANEKLFIEPDPSAYSGNIEPDAYGLIHDFAWLDDNTFQYYTYNQNLEKSAAKTIEL